MQRDPAYLLDMLQAAREARHLCTDLTWDTYQNSKLHQYALVKLIEIIGEAARAVSEETKAAQPAIPWAPIIDMRNRPVHRYFRIDLPRVWDVLQNHLVPLIGQLEALVPPEQPRPRDMAAQGERPGPAVKATKLPGSFPWSQHLPRSSTRLVRENALAPCEPVADNPASPLAGVNRCRAPSTPRNAPSAGPSATTKNQSAETVVRCKWCGAKFILPKTPAVPGRLQFAACGPLLPLLCERPVLGSLKAFFPLRRERARSYESCGGGG